MNYKQKLQALKERHFAEWFSARMAVEREMSDAQTMFCVCGRLATGMHERSCPHFRTAVNKATVKRMEHLLEKATAREGGE